MQQTPLQAAVPGPCAYFAQSFGCSHLQPFIETLCTQLEQGHVCIQLSPQEAAQAAQSPLLGTENNTHQPFILHNRHFYYQRYFMYETQVVQFVQQRWQMAIAAQARATERVQQQEALINQLFAPTEATQLRPRQAAIMALTHPFCILTGGPGTGKTTTLARLLFLLLTQQPLLRVALAAPTGKAAARMKESLQKSAAHETMAGLTIDGHETVAERFARLEPQTIHLLLGVQRQSHYFRHHAGHPLLADLLVVDECSMMDLALMAKLLSACGPETQVIFLGDRHQLSSVEAGSVFGDLCTAFGQHLFPPQLAAPITELTHSWRFQAQQGIGQLSHAVLHKDVEAIAHLYSQPPHADAALHLVPDAPDGRSEALTRFAHSYRRYIVNPAGQPLSHAEALTAFGELRILCALREGRYGVYELNRLVAQHLRQQNLIADEPGFYEHQPILVTENLHSQGLYNGDVGLLRRNEEGRLMAWFMGANAQPFSIAPSMLPRVETAFAMTIHKSQGSEFTNVFVVLPPWQPQRPSARLLTAELVYTAITRAREKLHLQCTMETLVQATTTRIQRNSGLTGRLV